LQGWRCASSHGHIPAAPGREESAGGAPPGAAGAPTPGCGAPSGCGSQPPEIFCLARLGTATACAAAAAPRGGEPPLPVVAQYGVAGYGSCVVEASGEPH
jgi:hypothetical protein